MLLPTPKSSFITKVEYIPVAQELTEFRQAHPHAGFLVVSTARQSYAYLVPSYVPGLFASAVKRGASTGRLYCRIVKGLPNVKLTRELASAQ